ncbi:MAG: hypothetical protein HRT57_09615 [Crocinitomicaceae bacterium]|nr:hypothetical protein [Crocinitomicaceae bacterium]
MRLSISMCTAVAGTFIVASCSRPTSETTNWEFNNPKTGGFQQVPFIDQETGPRLLLVEGGSFTMGQTEQDVMDDWTNRPARVTVSSFYMGSNRNY